MGLTRNLQNAYFDCGDPDRFATSTISPESEAANVLIGHKSAALAAAQWPTANKALFFPFTVTGRASERPIAITGFIVMNGAAAAGNVDVGIYDAKGNKLASTGSTAVAGVTQPQRINLSVPLQLKPGRYYLAMASDTAGAGQTFVSVAPLAQALRAAGVRERTTSFPLPADASTWVGCATAYVPWVTSVELGVS